MMKYKSFNEINVFDKPKVYFTCHPKDFEKYFDVIRDDIFGICDCTIYYTESMSEQLSEDDYADLSRMNLFVVPVTRSLLEKDNRTIRFDIKYAMENDIPVLPFMMESGLDSLYGDFFDERQYINPYSTDLTEISYKEKLSRYLKSVLISADTAQRVRDAFDAYIFLSYRKRDRKHTNELMNLIHSNPEFQDIAIWFDEFLTPGESFKDNINKMLKDSKMFTLLVTPSLLETVDGKPNFVMAEEYPAAKNAGKEILPAEMESTDKSALKACYKDIPECVDAYNNTEFRERLLDSLRRIAIKENDHSPAHNYLIGLAYMHGIDVEVNRSRAIKLITSAADGGYIEAIKKLATMYYYGIDISRDYEQASLWQKKYIEKMEQNCSENTSAEKMVELVDAIRLFTEIERNRSNASRVGRIKLIELLQKAEKILDTVDFTADSISDSKLIESKLNTIRSLAILNEQAGYYDESLRLYNKALDLRKRIEHADTALNDDNTRVGNRWRIAQIYHDLGLLMREQGKHKEAVDALLNSLSIYKEIYKFTDNYVSNMLGVYDALSYSTSFVDVEIADNLSREALEISDKYYKKNPLAFDLVTARTLLSRVFVLTELGCTDYDLLESLCLRSVNLFEQHTSDGSFQTLFNYMNAMYKLANIYRRKNDLNNAKAYYVKSLGVAEELSESVNTETKEVIAHLYFDYGTFSVIDPDGIDFDKASTAISTALNLFKEISVTKDNYEEYVDEAIEVLEKLEAARNQMSREHSTQTGSVDPDTVAAFGNFQEYYSKGDASETNSEYKKAYHLYMSALEKLNELKSLGASVDEFFADLYDRIAFCAEMANEFEEAERYYEKAVMDSLEIAKNTGDPQAYEIAIEYMKKLTSFYHDRGNNEKEREYLHFIDVLLQKKGDLDSEVDDEDNEDFLSPELREKLNKALDELDFTPTTFKEGDEFDYADDLGDEDEGHHLGAMIKSLFSDERLLSLLDDEEEVQHDEEEELDSTITLTDENGESTDFTFADLIEFGGKEYVVLLPPEDEEQEVTILLVEPGDDDDTENYLPVEDEKLLAFLFEIFKERNKDRFNFED